MKNLCILGSTGSIGRNTLQIVEMFPERFAVKALAAKTNTQLLARQIEKFHPEMVAVFDAQRALELKNLLVPGIKTEILYGDEGYKTAASVDRADMVVAAMVGAAGLMPTLAAIDAGKDIALANKETLVMAGDLVIKRATEIGVSILPVDSEHSAIFQCLLGHRKQDLQSILLTASGGPFLNRSLNDFSNIKPEEALNHPTWQMGKKISIDSATLMNKGLEVIEAQHLFGVSTDRIEVVIHPQSIIHSMVSYLDGTVLAQLGIPNMKAAIAYALSYPERLPLKQPIPDFAAVGHLKFQQLEPGKFPCLELAFKASRVGGTLPTVLNAANEVAVHAFLNRQVLFTEIPEIIAKVVEEHPIVESPAIDDILAADQWARERAEEVIRKIQG